MEVSTFSSLSSIGSQESFSLEETSPGQKDGLALWVGPGPPNPDGNSLEDKLHIHELGKCPSLRPGSLDLGSQDSDGEEASLTDQAHVVPEAAGLTDLPPPQKDHLATSLTSGYASGSLQASDQGAPGGGVRGGQEKVILIDEGEGDGGHYLSIPVKPGLQEKDIYHLLKSAGETWRQTRNREGFELRMGDRIIEADSRIPVQSGAQYTVVYI